MKDMWWYLDTRRFGTCPHSGKSIGGFLLVQAGSSLCSLRSAVRPSSFRGEGGHTPLAIFSYSEEGKVMLDVLKNERNDAS